MYNKDRNLQRSNNKIMGKYNLKKQTGAISVFVMMAMLFFLLTILGIYLISTRRAQAQTEAFKMAQERYYSEDAEELYYKKIAGPNETIPIYTKEQLWSIGKERKIEIEGKVYDFSGQDFSKYELKNDIIINISESLEIVDGDIKKNDYEIYYYYEENYYVPATGTTVDLTIGENRFVLKNNSSQTLGYVKDGLLLHYDGIKNTGTGHDSTATTWKDLSGNGNDGILNGATWEENSLNFDGINDFVNVNKSDTISPQNQTIEVVLKCNGPSKETSADKRQIFFVKWIGYTMELNTDNTISYGRSDKTTYLRSVNKLNHGTIANITATNGNNISTLYFNNIQENQTQTVPAMYSGMNNISIGNYSNGRHFNGNIYAIRMYNRVLTEAELAKNYEIDKKRFNIQETNYVTDGLVLHYDGINNTGNGHASGATTWKDLSGNGNDGILNGFNDDENNGWNANYLKFDGVNDSIVTSKEIDYKGSKAITVQFVDVNGIFDNLNLAMLFESSYNFNDVEGGYLIDTREHGEKGDLAFATSKKGYGYNAKNGKNILKSGNQMYTVICNNMNTHDNYISFFTNLDQANVEEIVPHNTNITNLSFANHKFYIGARNNAQYFAKMNLGSIRVYNKALSQEEIQKNYQIDKARFNIQ